MPLELPNVTFTTNDRGGEYYEKLQLLAAAVDAAIAASNANAGLAATFEDYIKIIIPDYIGSWPDLTGAASIDDVVYHPATDSLWRAINPIASIPASQPGVSADWEPEGDRYATVAQGAKADTAMQPGAGGWLGSAINLSTANVTTCPLGTLYYSAGTHTQAVGRGLPDLGATGSTPVYWEIFTHGTSTRTVQEVVQLLSVDGKRGQQFINIKEGSTWQGWQPSGGGGGGANGPYLHRPLVTLSNNDADGSNNIDITIDLSLGTMFFFDCNGAPLMGTAGTIRATVINLPAGSDTGITFQVWFRRAGRKGVTWVLPDGVTASWAGSQSYGSAAGSEDLVQGYWVSALPSTLKLSIIEKR